MTTLQDRLAQVRALSEEICAPLAIEDFGLQAIPETSPAKWHLAHTTWFFETFILKPFSADYQPRQPRYEVLFNSYYNSIGEQHPRAERGLLSRPTVADVMDYRQQVNAALEPILSQGDPEVDALIELGIHHEQQHQELIFTDLKYNFSRNPLAPAYKNLAAPLPASSEPTDQWTAYSGGQINIGQAGTGFCFDNETPRHAVLVQDFELRDQLVTNREYFAFIEDGGYSRPELWLADGWTSVQSQRWQSPLYWDLDKREEFTLYGQQPLSLNQPVNHVSAYEADAFCRWAGYRLPSEAEWEYAAVQQDIEGQFLEDGYVHAIANVPGQLHGGLWQWTSSAYAPYPGFHASNNAVGEYNRKFMANQLVLRGGSCVTSRDHIRSSYRNFFYPPDRWQFTGIRMARWL